MKVLLVEPKYKSDYLPLGLMKIARFFYNKDADVRFKRGFADLSDCEFKNFNPDEIYVTSLYTWDFDNVAQTVLSYAMKYKNIKIYFGGIGATLLYDKFKEAFRNFQNIIIHKGLKEEFETQLPYYGIFPKTDYFIGFTSRGCIRKCEYCNVRIHEPTYEEHTDFFNKLIDWDVAHYKNHLLMLDNNLLASSEKHFNLVYQKLYAVGNRFTIDFNQGLDCRLLTKEKAEKLVRINLLYIRFAFDTMEQDGFVQKAVKMIRDTGCNTEIRNMTLYNYTDTPEDFYYRLEQQALLEVKSFPMKYQPLTTTIKSDYVGKNWSRKMLMNFTRINQYPNGMIIVHKEKDTKQKFNITNFYEVFGRNAKEFVEKLKGKTEDIDQKNLFDYE